MKLAIIGDFNPSAKSHLATNQSIEHAAGHLGLQVPADWLATEDLLDSFPSIVANYNGFWIAPGSPYKSMNNVLEIIQYARLHNIPVLGTCGGFQHMVIEFARNVLGIGDAQHAEYDPRASKLIIDRLTCSLAGQKLTINITDKQSLVYNILHSDTIEERYYCNFGINPAFQMDIDKGGFGIVGSDDSGEARILELVNHKFFIATLFLPQVNSTSARPHPLVAAFIETVCKSSLL